VASTVAEPVVCVSHQMIAKDTSWLPSSENAWAVHMVKKRPAQGFDFSKGASTDIFSSQGSQDIYDYTQ
jgi:hypothetical protein